MKALIIIAHGSRKALSNSEFNEFVKQIAKEDTSYDKVLPAFLELCEPSIEESTKILCEDSYDEIYYYPYFLNSGRHILSDIPEIIEKLQKEYSDKKLILLPHFGKSEKIKNVILEDIELDK